MASVAFCRQFDNKNNCQKKGRTKRERETKARANKQSKCQPPKTIFQANIYKSEREMEVTRGRERRRTDARQGQPLEKKGTEQKQEKQLVTMTKLAIDYEWKARKNPYR